MAPNLTTVQVPHRAMGVRATERLLDMVVDGVQPESPLLMPVTLIVRQSTAPAPQRQHGVAAPRRATPTT
jgi:LacI family transcriptional regulator